MLKEVEEKITEVLTTEDIYTKKYFGEFKNPQEFKSNLNNLPLVFVDFTGSDPENFTSEKANLSLYIAHVAFSKNEKTRAKKHYELYDLHRTIKQKLRNLVVTKTFNDIEISSEPMKLGKMEKIHDAIFNNGYLTVFKLNLSIIIKEL